jgi:hypothetical protein
MSVDVGEELLDHTLNAINRNPAAEDVAIPMGDSLSLIEDCRLLSELTQIALDRMGRIPQELGTSAVEAPKPDGRRVRG